MKLKIRKIENARLTKSCTIIDPDQCLDS